MKWHILLKGIEETPRIRQGLDRMRRRLERRVQNFDHEQVALRGVIEKHPSKVRFRVSFLFAVPGRILIAKEERPELDVALREAVSELERQLDKHKAVLRRELVWKRKERRKESALAGKVSELPLEERDRQAFLGVIEAHLDTLQRFARREIAARLASGEVLPGQVTPDDVVNAVIETAAREFPRRPKDLSLDRWLVQLVLDNMKKEVARAREMGGPLRLEEASAVPGSAEGFFDFYQPDEVVKLEDLLPASEIPTPEQEIERWEFQRWINQTLSHLPSQWRLALVLHGAEGYSVEDTARLLGLSESETKQALDSAKAFLRHKLIEIAPFRAKAEDEKGQESLE